VEAGDTHGDRGSFLRIFATGRILSAGFVRMIPRWLYRTTLFTVPDFEVLVGKLENIS
jgi:hypothetical protein